MRSLLFHLCRIVFALLFSQSHAGSVPSEVQEQNVVSWNGARYKCKCYDGDKCWPSPAEWKALNASVDGNLEWVIPDPAPCYNTFEGKPVYDAAACKNVLDNWGGQQWQADRAVSNHWVLWTNTTCLPTTNPNDQCTLGNFPRYVILAKKKEHVKAGIDFARRKNLRLVIRNTGHDFLGRSTGFGSLAINTHSFKDIEFVKKYTGPGHWTGGAAIIGAGVQAFEVLRLANQQDPKVTVVTGECATVGIAGGFVQGGGHGPLATLHGLAADQVLSFEVITADGAIITANAERNADLFWGLRGGGPSAFAAVLSVTFKTFLDTPTAGVILNINQTHTTNETLFWKGFTAFHNLSPHWIDNGMFVYYEVFPGSLHIQPFVGPNMDKEKITKVVQPLFDQLEKDGVPYSAVVKEFPTFYDLYIDLFEPEFTGAKTFVGGRLFTRQDIVEHGDEIAEAVKGAVAAGLIGHIVGPGHGAPVVDNAINPVWRKAVSFSITLSPVAPNASLSNKATAQKLLTIDIDGPLRRASPYGAAYINEGDLEEPNWQTTYWGSNYPRLKQLKKKWDPKGVFYARTTPGTEEWEVIEYGTKLCKKV